MKRPQLPPDSGHERAHEVFLDALRTALTAARKLPGVDECDVRAAASTMAKVMQEFSSQWNPNRQCTGMKTKTKRCKTLIPYAKWCQKWPGVSDRCQWHEDPLEVRSRDLAKMAQRCGAAGKESLPTAKRLEQGQIAKRTRMICGDHRQMEFTFDVVGPTARQFPPDPDPAKTAEMLAAGRKTWGKSSA